MAKVTRLGLYGGPRAPYGTEDAATATSGGTAANVDQSVIVSPGGTITITLVNDTFIAAGTGKIGTLAESNAFVNAMTSPQVQATGWNVKVRDVLDNDDLLRTSDTVATLTVPPTAGFLIDQSETIIPVVQAAILTTSIGDITASSFRINFGTEISTGDLSFGSPGHYFTKKKKKKKRVLI